MVVSIGIPADRACTYSCPLLMNPEIRHRESVVTRLINLISANPDSMGNADGFCGSLSAGPDRSIRMAVPSGKEVAGGA